MYVEKTAKQILASNLSALMAMREDVKTQQKLAAKASKAGGRKVAQTTISNMLNPEENPSPTLRNIEAVAAVFSLQAWQLLHPTLGDQEAAAEFVAKLAAAPKRDQNIVYQVLNMQPVPDAVVAKHIKPAKTTTKKR